MIDWMYNTVIYVCSYDDDLWAETADPNTGSVFYVTPNVSPSVAIPSSSSSSSLSSSNLSIADTGVTSPVSNRLFMGRWGQGK